MVRRLAVMIAGVKDPALGHPALRVRPRRPWVPTPISVMVAVAVTVTSLAACGISTRIKTEPVFFTALNSCLEKHGIAHPETTPRPTQEELAIPRLISLGGMRVPIGVTRTQLEGALKQCGADF